MPRAKLAWKGHLRTGEAVTGVKCPHKFCDGRIVYSGNYFCEFSIGVLPAEKATCDFILVGEERTLGDDGKEYVYEAPPLHTRVWNQIKKDLGVDEDPN